MQLFCLLNACTDHILNGSTLCQVVGIDLSAVPVIQVREFNHKMSCTEQLCKHLLCKIKDLEAYSVIVKKYKVEVILLQFLKDKSGAGIFFSPVFFLEKLYTRK